MIKPCREQDRIKSARDAAHDDARSRMGSWLGHARFRHRRDGCRQPGVGGGELCHRDAWRAGLAGRFHAYALCQSRCAERRPAGAGHARHLRQPQPDDRAGDCRPADRRRAADARPRGREPDGARQRRGFHALWSLGQQRRDRRGEKPCHLPSRSAGAVLRRPTGARRRRAVLLGLAARSRPPQPPAVLFQGCQGRGARSADGAVRFRRRARSRAAADSGADADPAAPCHRCRDLRGDLDDRADGLRSLPRQRGQARRQRDADAQSGLLGPRPAGESRAVEFRRDPAGLLSRGQRPVRSLQARPLRLSGRERTAALA